MKDRLQQLMDRHGTLPGLAAWSARLPDGSIVWHCSRDWFTPKQLESALARLELAAADLASQGIEASTFCWNFERALVYFSMHAEGACLGLFVENRPATSRVPFDRLLEDFRLL